MRPTVAVGLALGLILLVLAACPSGVLSWSNGPAGNATTNQPGECATPSYATHDWIADHALALVEQRDRRAGGGVEPPRGHATTGISPRTGTSPSEPRRPCGVCASGMMCSWKGSRAARSDRTRIEQQHASQLVSHVAASSAQRIAEAGVTDRLIDTGANRSSRHADTLRRIEAANIRADVCGACEAPIAVGDPVEEASMRSRVRSVVLAGTLLAVGSSPAVAQNPNWTRPFEGHRVIGNLYAVGTYDLAVFLVTGSEGHILVNTGLEDSTPLIRENIESLGFRLEDVKILLQMQAHWDHTAALAEIKRITGAEMWATLHDAPVLADGGFSDPHFGGRQSFDPVAVDKIIRDGEVIELGDIRMTVLETPGHTAGSSSYLMQVREGGGTYDVAIANMAFINPGKRLVENPTYPGVADDFAETFRKQKALDVDVWVSAHGSQYGLHDKYQPGQAYSPDTFVDPEGFLGAVERLEQDYLAQLRAEGR